MKARLTDRQIGWALTEIANTAHALDHLSMMHEAGVYRDIPGGAEAAHYAVQTLARRMGAIAEVAAKSVDGYHPVMFSRGGDVMRWLMPSHFFSEQATKASPKA